MHLKYNNKENKMAMKVKKQIKSKWRAFCEACGDVRLARKNVKTEREKITVCRQRLDYDAERPIACFVKYSTVAFPWFSESHPAEDTEFVSVCSHVGNDGLCDTDGNDRCQMLKNRTDYELAVQDLESVLATRRECFCALFGKRR